MLTLLVGLDKVLITDDFRDARMSPNIRVFSYDVGDADQRRFLCRPYTPGFIERCQAIFDAVYLVEWLPHEEILTILHAMDMQDDFTGIVGKEDLLQTKLCLLSGDPSSSVIVPSSGEVGLVDIDTSDDISAATKLAHFGVPVWEGGLEDNTLLRSQLMSVPAFYGDPDDIVLVQTLCSFEDVLSSSTGT